MAEFPPFWSGFVAGCAAGCFVMAQIMDWRERRLQRQFDEAIRLASVALVHGGRPMTLRECMEAEECTAQDGS